MNRSIFLLIFLITSSGIFAQKISIQVFGGLDRNFYQSHHTNPLMVKLNSSPNNFYGAGIAMRENNIGVKVNFIRGRLNNRFGINDTWDFYGYYYGIELLGCVRFLNKKKYFIEFSSGIVFNSANFINGHEIRGRFSSGDFDYYIVGFTGTKNSIVYSLASDLTIGYKLSDHLNLNSTVFYNLGLVNFYNGRLEYNILQIPSGKPDYIDNIYFINKADLIGIRLGIQYEF